MPRRLLPLLVLAVVIGLAALIGLRWGKPSTVARPNSRIVTAPVGGGGTIAWIEQDAASYRLRAKRGRGAPVEALAGEVISGLAVHDGRILTTTADASSGATKLRSIGPGGDSRDIATLAGPAGQIATDGDLICWAEAGTPRLPAAPFIAAGGPVVVVGAMSVKGGTPVAVAGELGSAQADLVGTRDGRVYWLERQQRGGEEVTRIMRGSVRGGDPEVLAEEPGMRSAILLAGRLAWTAPSQEAAAPTSFVSVKTMPLSGGAPVVIADWLGPAARLLASGNTLYAQDAECLWRLGDARGTQRIVYSRSYGPALPALIGSDEYLVSDFGKETALLARGVTWTAKLRHALGLGL